MDDKVILKYQSAIKARQKTENGIFQINVWIVLSKIQ